MKRTVADMDMINDMQVKISNQGSSYTCNMVCYRCQV